MGLLRIGIAGTVTVGGVGEDDGGQRPQRLEVADLEGLHRHLHHRRRGDPLGQTGQVLGLTRGQVQRVGQAAVVVAQGGAGQRLGPGPNRRPAQGDPDRTIGALAGTVARLRNAYENGVKITFSTDADYYVPGMTRGEVTINFLKTWKAAEIPAKDILKAMTITGYEVCELTNRGPIKVGNKGDIIAVAANPLADIDALRDVRFVMKDGQVFKRDGVMTPMDFFHSGPEYGWRVR